MSTEKPSLRIRLTQDLRTATKEHDTLTMRTLRSLLDAMDNASAVPMTAEHVPVYGRSGDVPRKVVTENDYALIVRREAAAHEAAIQEYEHLGRYEAAAQVQAELNLIRRYIDADSAES